MSSGELTARANQNKDRRLEKGREFTGLSRLKGAKGDLV